MGRYFTLAAFLLIGICGAADAGVKSKAAKEAAEYVLGKFGKEAAEQGVETLTRKIEVLAVKHGDDAITAVKNVGPRTFRIVEEAGEHGPQAIKLMARHGDDVVWVVAKKNRLAIFVKYGDDAAESMMKHGEMAEPLIHSMGKPAAGALNAVSKQNGRRLAMMAADDALTKIGRTDDLLEVVRKHGDAAMDFIWANKGSLTVAAALTAFLANPEPFINGTADITKVVAENVGQPLASVPGQVASEAARTTNWTLVLSVVVVVVGGIAGVKVWLRHRKTALAVLLCSSVLLSGCGTSALPPPVTVSYRSSLVAFTEADDTSSKFLPVTRTHGSKHGFQLTDGTFVTWTELSEVFRSINQAVSGKLVVCLSCCEGFTATHCALFADPLPFASLVGHTGGPTWAETAVAFTAFYHLLRSGRQVKDAVQGMKAASGNEEFRVMQGSDITPLRQRIEKLGGIEKVFDALRELREKQGQDSSSPVSAK